MTLLERIRQRAGAKPQRIVLPEGDDPRIIAAAAVCVRERLAHITIIGDEQKIRATAREVDVDFRGIEIIDHRRAPDFEKMVSLFHDLRRPKGMTRGEARTILTDPVYYGDLMVRMGRADGCVAGATNTSPHTVRAALHCIGMRPELKRISSFFLIALRDAAFGHHGAMIFADCSVMVEPSAADLADIAIASADSCRVFLGAEPRVAILTATKDSGPFADRFAEAASIACKRAPKLKIAVMPVDVALDVRSARVQRLKSSVAGRANVFIFPDLQSANIALKLTERLAGATAVGAVLQGLNKPANDLSRGCKVGEIADLIAITALQVQPGKPAW